MVPKSEMHTAIPPPSFPQRRRAWTKRLRRFERSNRLYLRLAALTFLIFQLWPRKPHPTTIAAPASLLRVPRPGEDVLTYAQRHGQRHGLPVYILYKARSGQLNNQLISFFNALAIAKAANATLVAPFAFYGSESYIDFGSGRGFWFHLREAIELHITEPILKSLGLHYRYDELVGDYLDGELLNRTQSVVSIMGFRTGEGGSYLKTFPHVLTRRGDAPFHYMSLGKRTLFETNINIRGEHQDDDPTSALVNPASRKELDCNFNISDYFRGLPYHAGANGNFLFLAKLYRSHSLNCTAANPYWLQLRRFVQPRVEIRRLVDNELRNWGNVLSVHLRLFPFDQGKFSTDKFCAHFVSEYSDQLREVNRVYIAYSVSSEQSIDIIAKLRKALGEEKIVTAKEYGTLHDLGQAFNKRYSAPLVDMWTCVNSKYFVGRLGSSLSWNVVYWREALQGQNGASHAFYRLQDFSMAGQKNPTDSYGF